MSELLKKAIKKLKKLPEKEQNNIAELLLEELHWDISFSHSQSKLEMLANETVEEYRKGKTKLLRFNTLQKINILGKNISGVQSHRCKNKQCNGLVLDWLASGI